ncbi:MAG: ABC transporter permease [Microscillaceae bacterium]|nr:ABC transporter permease [Microscillaceae bacterium]
MNQTDSKLYANDEWTEVINPQKSWFDLRLKELWQYRDLVILFVRRDFVAIYKQTILGPIWHIIQPLLTTLTFTIVFGQIAGISTDGQPQFLFYMAGVTVWSYFASCLTKTSSVFTSNADMFGKVYFPRLTVPVATVISALIAFGIQLFLFLMVYAGFFIMGTSLKPTLWLLAIPYFIVVMAIFGLGMGIVISSLTTKYKDLVHLVNFGVQLFMYATPVIYPLSAIHSERAQFYLSLNPLAPLIEGFRYAFFGSGVFTGGMLLNSTLVSLVIFLIGLGLFHRVEKSFMDTV